MKLSWPETANLWVDLKFLSRIYVVCNGCQLLKWWFCLCSVPKFLRTAEAGSTTQGKMTLTYGGWLGAYSMSIFCKTKEARWGGYEHIYISSGVSIGKYDCRQSPLMIHGTAIQLPNQLCSGVASWATLSAQSWFWGFALVVGIGLLGGIICLQVLIL